MVKYTIGLTVSGMGQRPAQIIDLFKFVTSSDNSFYLIPFPFLFRGTGFHWSIHPSGVSHLRATNPRISVDFPIYEFTKTLTLDGYKISLEPFLRPPRVGTPALITIISERHVQKCLYQIGANKFFIDPQKMFEPMTIAAVRDTSDLSYAIPTLKRLGYIQDGDSVIITPTETSEFSIFYDRPSYDIDSKCLLPSKEESLRKLGGYFFTVEKPIEGGIENFLRLPVFRPLFEPMQEFMNKLDKAGVKLANQSLSGFEDALKTEHILQKKRVLELT